MSEECAASQLSASTLAPLRSETGKGGGGGRACAACVDAVAADVAAAAAVVNERRLHGFRARDNATKNIFFDESAVS